MKAGIFITIRKDSSRLPNKAVREILGQPVMQLVIKRAQVAKGFDAIVVCTTDRTEDDEIEQIARANGVDVYRGSLNDKLERWNGAARQFGITHIVTFDGDDLFCEPKLLELGLKQIEEGEYDFIEAPKGLICGAFTYAFTCDALKKVCEVKNTDDTEMMWTYFKDTGLFRTSELKDVDSIYFDNNIRCTLDYPEDMKFFQTIFEHFGDFDNKIELERIIRYIHLHPEVAKINIGRQQEFLENQKRKTHLELKR